MSFFFRKKKGSKKKEEEQQKEEAAKWECHVCGAKGMPSWNNCGSCGAERKSAAWPCPACTLENKADAKQCAACNTARPLLATDEERRKAVLHASVPIQSFVEYVLSTLAEEVRPPTRDIVAAILNSTDFRCVSVGDLVELPLSELSAIAMPTPVYEAIVDLLPHVRTADAESVISQLEYLESQLELERENEAKVAREAIQSQQTAAAAAIERTEMQKRLKEETGALLAAEKSKLEAEEKEARLQNYQAVLELALVDDKLTKKEEKVMKAYRKKHNISDEEHLEVMARINIDLGRLELLREKSEDRVEREDRTAWGVQAYIDMLRLAVADDEMGYQEVMALESLRRRYGITDTHHSLILEDLKLSPGDLDRAKANHISKNDFAVPTYWQDADEKDGSLEARFVDLDPSLPEYKEAVDSFFKTLNRSTYEVLSIQYVQNPENWRAYCFTRSQFRQRLGEDRMNERRLWHATGKDNVHSIANRNFRREFTNRAAYGFGSYFARDSSYSAAVRYAKPDEERKQRMFMCRVLVGEPCQGHQGMKTPKVKPSGRELFDCAVNQTSNPSVFVIFNDHQAYPDLLLTFRKKNQ